MNSSSASSDSSSGDGQGDRSGDDAATIVASSASRNSDASSDKGASSVAPNDKTVSGTRSSRTGTAGVRNEGGSGGSDGASPSVTNSSASGSSSDGEAGNLGVLDAARAMSSSSSSEDGDNETRKRKMMFYGLLDRRPGTDAGTEMSHWVEAAVALARPTDQPLGDNVKNFLSSEPKGCRPTGSTMATSNDKGDAEPDDEADAERKPKAKETPSSGANEGYG